jgi:hypothetical protein
LQLFDRITSHRRSPLAATNQLLLKKGLCKRSNEEVKKLGGIFSPNSPTCYPAVFSRISGGPSARRAPSWALRASSKSLILGSCLAQRRAVSRNSIAQIAQLPCVSSDPDSRKEI